MKRKSSLSSLASAIAALLIGTLACAAEYNPNKLAYHIGREYLPVPEGNGTITDGDTFVRLFDDWNVDPPEVDFDTTFVAYQTVYGTGCSVTVQPDVFLRSGAVVFQAIVRESGDCDKGFFTNKWIILGNEYRGRELIYEQIKR